jgi:diguanylate cyclase (GGDEF)-like protein/PAS domain S-box-containing protein
MTATNKKRLNLQPRRSEPTETAPPWYILVVDDDPGVHDMTRVLLRDLAFQGRPFEVISAYSAAEAKAALATRPDIPVALVDVVMESEQAGLQLVHSIRRELGNQTTRIILRTGQPGEAPERDVVLAYDINDYKSKTELTAQKLFTAVVGAVRSWSDIVAVERLKATLETRVEERTRELAQARRFAERLIETLPNPVWFKDPNGRYRLTNRAFCDFFGGVGEAWNGRSVEELPCSGLAEPDLSTDALVRSGQAARIEHEVTLGRADGAQRTVLLAKSALEPESGESGGIIGVLTDITERKQMERDLHRLATTDPLTGAANRRQFMAAATQEVERSLRYGNGLSMIMLDVDHFKRINDEFGHSVGDEALVAVVNACRATLREVDVVGRMGGEEFAVLLPETALTGALEVAERLRRAIAAARPRQAPAGLVLTASLGVAQRTTGETLVDQILGRADRALYAAKNEGRDRVCAAG